MAIRPRRRSRGRFSDRRWWWGVGGTAGSGDVTRRGGGGGRLGRDSGRKIVVDRSGGVSS